MLYVHRNDSVYAADRSGKYGVTLIVMIGAVKLIEWANEGCPAFLAGVMAGLTTLILSFCGSLLEWKNQPDGAAVFLEAVFILVR